MSSFHSSLNHIIFSTKDRKSCLTSNHRDNLFRYINTTCQNKNCHPYEINGVEDHIHILCSIHPSVAVADFVKSIKTSSNSAIKDNNWFENFAGWQIGYGHFTASMNQLEVLSNYIRNQEEHHAKMSSKEELMKMLHKFNVPYDPRYFE